MQNWFQNRRAKAKQQKRQEEFERSQALAKSEESADGSASSSQSDEHANNDGKLDQKQEPPGYTDSSITPTLERPDTSKSEDAPVLPAESQKDARPFNDIAPKAAAASGRPQDTNTSATGAGVDVAQISTVGQQNGAIMPAQSQVDLSFDVTSSQHSNPELLGVGIDAATSAMWAAPLQAPGQFPVQESASHSPALSANPNLEFQGGEIWPPMQHPNGHFVPVGHPSYQHDNGQNEWDQMTMGTSLPNQTSVPESLCSASLPVSDSQALPHQQHCGSCTSEHASLSSSVPSNNNNNSTSQTMTSEPQLPETAPSQDTSLMSRQLDKRIDLAARRKRPRPAAIGTTGFNRSRLGPSSMSPTARLPPNSAGHPLRHAKSTQNIGSNLSPHYTGIRKSSAALRSPLGFGNVMEPNVSNPPNTDSTVSSMVTTTTMAPPTPLTPEELQYLLPQTPNDAQYCVSPSQDTSYQGWFSNSQSMPLQVQSPPMTPLHPSLVSHMQYQAMQGPPSAPAHQTAFESYAIPEAPPPGSAEGYMWPVEAVPKSIQEQPIQMPQPIHVSSVLHHGGDGLVDTDHLHMPPGQLANNNNNSSSPPHSTSNLKTPTNISTDDTTPPAFHATDFFFQEFSQSQKPHSLAPQHLPPQNPPDLYTRKLDAQLV